LETGDRNLERAMKMGDRLDGHSMVQNTCRPSWNHIVAKAGGSWLYTFEYDEALSNSPSKKQLP
jgi:riboflavin synthase